MKLDQQGQDGTLGRCRPCYGEPFIWLKVREMKVLRRWVLARQLGKASSATPVPEALNAYQNRTSRTGSKVGKRPCNKARFIISGPHALPAANMAMQAGGSLLKNRYN